MDMVDKIIQLDNNERYAVADSFTYSNKVYLILGKMIDNDNIENAVAFAELIDNKIKKITDEKEINQLKEIYKLSLN